MIWGNARGVLSKKMYSFLSLKKNSLLHMMRDQFDKNELMSNTIQTIGIILHCENSQGSDILI